MLFYFDSSTFVQFESQLYNLIIRVSMQSFNMQRV